MTSLFSIVNLPFISSNISAQYSCFLDRPQLLTQELLKQGHVAPRLNSSLQKLYGRHHNLVDRYEISISQIRVITKLPNFEQSSKGKVKTHKYINRQNQSTTGKLRKPLCPWLGTCISKEMVGWIRFYGAKPPAFITVQRFRMSL
jgi:hypothetical protein